MVSRQMVIWIARHGQPAIGGLRPGLSHELPPGDFALTARGREQARRLGGFLKSAGFAGRIIASPYLRTAETADVIAAECGCRFCLEPALQELRFDPACPERGRTLAELRERFGALASDGVLQSDWMVSGAESMTEVEARTGPWLRQLLAAAPAETEVLLVGHGATVTALTRDLLVRAGAADSPFYYWNCALSEFAVEPDGTVRVRRLTSIDFMPSETVTSNLTAYSG